MAVSFGNQDPGLRRWWSGWRAILLCWGLMVLSDMAMAVERRLALVIGNAAYSEAKLKNAVNDAKDIAVKLKAMGFEVTQLLDANYREMEDGVRRFTKALSGERSVALFYYAGHGLQVDGQNYLLPIDAHIENEADVRYKTVSAGWVLDGMNQAQGDDGINLVVLDACRNNPFTRSFHRSASRGFARMEPAKGTLILYATEPGKVAQDGEGKNGVFTEKLLQAMDQPGLSVEEVFKNAALAVNTSTGKAQTPWQEGVILGHFYFLPSSSSTVSPPVSFVPPDVELEFWRSTEKCGTRECYQDYLQRYPTGRFAGLANGQIKKLKGLEVQAEVNLISPPAPNTASPTTKPMISSPSGKLAGASEAQKGDVMRPKESNRSQVDDWLFGRKVK